jgi:hypothetical protein
MEFELSPDLDEAAEAVLRMLRRDARLRDLGLNAVRVNWRYGFAHFVFHGHDRELTRRASARGLIDTDLSELAASLVNSLVWRPRDEA